jgi:hypothetical protein
MIDCKREGTVFENHPKSLISKNCERILEWTKVNQTAKNGQFGEHLKN